MCVCACVCVCAGPTDKRRLRLDGLVIPPPVFSRAVEAQSQAEDKAVQAALAAMLLEDPSLQLRVDPDTGQTLLAGQGELHLEVVADRLRTEHGVDVRLGRMVVAYREALLGIDPATTGTARAVLDRELGGKRQYAVVALEVAPTAAAEDPTDEKLDTARDDSDRANGNTVDVQRALATVGEDGGALPTTSSSSAPSASGGAHLDRADLAQALAEGVHSALARGPLLGYPVAGVRVRVTDVTLSADSTLGAVAACAASAVRQVLTSPAASVRLLEPRMRVAVAVGADHMGAVLSDLTGVRRGRVLGIEHVTPTSVRIAAEAPLAALAGYASALRSVSSGYGTFSMQFARYGLVAADAQAAILADHGWRPPGPASSA
jgi:elongation factor G